MRQAAQSSWRIPEQKLLNGPGPPSLLSALSAARSKSCLCGSFVWAHGALNRPKRRSPARAVPLQPVLKLLDAAAVGGGCVVGRGRALLWTDLDTRHSAV
jgi:hypothetical protein